MDANGSGQKRLTRAPAMTGCWTSHLTGLS